MPAAAPPLPPVDGQPDPVKADGMTRDLSPLWSVSVAVLRRAPPSTTLPELVLPGCGGARVRTVSCDTRDG
jgi:hypothetical protein